MKTKSQKERNSQFLRKILITRLKEFNISEEEFYFINNLEPEVSQEQVQKELDKVYKKAGLGLTLETLFEQQVQSQFVADRLEKVEFHDIYDSEYNITFRAMFNPKREERHKGFGEKAPPEDSGIISVNNSCFLCYDNIKWQQRNRQKAFYWKPRHSVNEYIFLTNPFPIFTHHFTVASQSHIVQRINNDHVRDMLQFVDGSPGFTIFFNGQDAGASIPWHLHMQACKQRFPIEDANQREILVSGDVIISHLRYPVPALKIVGKNVHITDLVVSMIVRRWLEFDPNNHHTLNFICTKHEGKYIFYLILRDILKMKTIWMAGLPASVEMGGIVIWSHPVDRAKFDNFKKGFLYKEKDKQQIINGADFIKGILRDVSPKEKVVQSFIKSINWI
jgi:hypothetical protein